MARPKLLYKPSQTPPGYDEVLWQILERAMLNMNMFNIAGENAPEYVVESEYNEYIMEQAVNPDSVSKLVRALRERYGSK